MSDESRIPTNLRTLLILEIMGKSERPLTATQINAHLGLPKQTVHRLCATLEKEGFLTRQKDSMHYAPARRLRVLGAGLLNTSRMHIARRQILLNVARTVGETVNFALPDNAGMSYADRVETDWAFRIQLPIGTQVPFHCTASGKCFLASLKAKARNTIVSALPLEAMTENTLTTQDGLMDELEHINQTGFSIDNEEFMEGMVAVAVPVRDTSGAFLAALACHGPTQRFSVDDAIAHKDHLTQAAAQLTEALFAEP